VDDILTPLLVAAAFAWVVVLDYEQALGCADLGDGTECLVFTHDDFLYEMGVGLPPFGLLTDKLDGFALGLECIPRFGCIAVAVASLGIVLSLMTQFFLELGELGLHICVDAVLQLIHSYLQLS
jgi:hypothetical protein